MGSCRSRAVAGVPVVSLYLATSCLAAPPSGTDQVDAGTPAPADSSSPQPDVAAASELRWEAEDFDEAVSIDAVYSWEQQADDDLYAGYSGAGYLVAMPEASGDPSSGCFATVDTCGARLVYVFEAVAPGDYYLHIQSYAGDAGNNSLFYGIDRLPATRVDEEGTSLLYVNLACGAWTWDTAPAPIQVADTEPHELDLWMREDGTRLDALVLSPSPELPGVPGCSCPIENCPPR